jgi:hypothetical protein
MDLCCSAPGRIDRSTASIRNRRWHGRLRRAVHAAVRASDTARSGPVVVRSDANRDDPFGPARRRLAGILPRRVAGDGSGPFRQRGDPHEQPCRSSSCPNDVANRGSGPVISTPRFRAYFWGQWDAATQSQIQAEIDTIANSPAFYSRLLEYNIGQGSSGPSIVDSTNQAYEGPYVGPLVPPPLYNCPTFGANLDGEIGAELDNPL